MIVSNASFVDIVYSARKKDFDYFSTIVQEYEQFHDITRILEENTKNWGESVFGENKDVPDIQLSPQELSWKEYFENHNFPNSEDQRNLSDALTILTGIDINRFIRIIKPKKESYPAYIVIVPIGNSNGHSYKIGAPILSFGSGRVFYGENGEPGNTMTSNLKEIRLPTVEEINRIVLCTMYHLSVAAEHLVTNLIER